MQDQSGWVVVVDWRDGSLLDAKETVREALAGRGIDADDIGPENIRINYGSYRGDEPASGYFRVWVKEEVLKDRQ